MSTATLSPTADPLLDVGERIPECVLCHLRRREIAAHGQRIDWPKWERLNFPQAKPCWNCQQLTYYRTGRPLE